ncbi:sulfotransferase 1C4-like [Prorops nasuta]|uniref:sulfotransferase 1C4-like n=1 Tax=Prorops nasuta TaxID=863751 RepID=UPI0034CD4E5A
MDNLPKYSFLNEYDNAIMLKLFHGQRKPWLQVGNEKWTMPNMYLQYAELIHNFQARSSDVWVFSFPRSGTTWTQEIVWLIMNDLNFALATAQHLNDRFPFLECNMIIDTDVTEELVKTKINIEEAASEKMDFLLPMFDIVEKMPSPRFIKSHMPISFFPNVVNSDCKIIYIARNPKDVLVSLYHFNKTNLGWNFGGDFLEFCDLFLKNLVIWTPYFEHVKEAWNLRHKPNFLFLFYENLKKEIQVSVKTIANFLGKEYNSQQIQELCNYVDFQNFKKNAKNYGPYTKVYPSKTFIREGHVGGWKSIITPDIEKKINAWIEENLKDTDLSFPEITQD